MRGSDHVDGILEQMAAEQGILLHHEATVKRGPCGYPELQKFAQAPTLQDYKLLVIDETCSYCVDAFGPPKDKQLVVLYNQQHYDTLTTLPAFFGTSYFYGHCLRPYNNEGQDACENNLDHCPACLQDICSDCREAKCQRCPAFSHVTSVNENLRNFTKF